MKVTEIEGITFSLVGECRSHYKGLLNSKRHNTEEKSETIAAMCTDPSNSQPPGILALNTGAHLKCKPDI